MNRLIGGQCRGPHLRRADPGAIRVAPHAGRPGAMSHEPWEPWASTSSTTGYGRPSIRRGTEVTRFGRIFREGDRVLQTVNNYDKDVFNGDLGWVSGVDHAAGRVRVNFEETGVDYDFSDLDELQPSFAMTVHRAQGSEFPAMVVPVLTQHYPMLQRNLLYTAITRGRRLVVVVGSRKALAMAVRNDRPGGRNTMLGSPAHGDGDGRAGRRFLKVALSASGYCKPL